MANRYRFPASNTLGFYVVLDTHTGGIVPGVAVTGNHLTNDERRTHEFKAQSLLWNIRANSIDELSAKLEFVLHGR